MANMARYYQVLELEDGASSDAVERAYRELTKVWHPDRFLSESPTLQQKAEEKQKEINEAYEELRAYWAAPPSSGPLEARGVREPSPLDPDPPPSPSVCTSAALTRVGRLVSDWLGPILRKVRLPSELLQDNPGIRPTGAPCDPPRNQGNRPGQGQGRGQGRGSGRGKGPRQGRKRQRRG